MFEVKGANVKHKIFPENPFLRTCSKIVMIDAAVVVATIALVIWKEAFMWYAIVGGVLLAIVVFVVLNKQCLRKL